MLDTSASAAATATHRRTAVDPNQPCVEAEGDPKDQLCVPLVSLKGDSYRLKDRDLGRVPTAATEEQ